MLPTVVAHEMRETVSNFLRSAFPFSTRYFQLGAEGATNPTALIDRLLAEPASIFQGPYLDLKLPYRLAVDAVLPFSELTLGYTPYQHQMQAFERLTGESPRSTIIATGTGSGKTECFMLPVLEDCLKRREQGIKTIIIYPMNTLAADQARRFAAEIAKLETRLTVGLFVGGDTKQAETAMGPRNVITDHDTLRRNPPDILLTNYKMLDFLLIRPRDQPLWRFNTPGMLRYLVVDELHTFDGAQGTDLACLIRRLRDRLGAGVDLACIGTSATMGTGAGPELMAYASRVFATPFDREAIIGEHRLSPEEYLSGLAARDATQNTTEGAIRFHNWPDGDEQRLDPGRYETAGAYLYHQSRLWFPGAPTAALANLQSDDVRKRAEAHVLLGHLLHQHKAFHQLVLDTSGTTHIVELASDWQQDLGLPALEQAQRLLMSLTSLIAAARIWDREDHEDPSKWTKPFLELRQQLWLRELRRIVSSVPAEPGASPMLRFADDLQDPEKPLHLPLLQCRECHIGAWGGVIKKGDNHVTAHLQTFYQDWFGNSPRATLLVPLAEGEQSIGPEQFLCPHCCRLQPKRSVEGCVECTRDDLIRVWVPNIVSEARGRLRCTHDCPECGARDAMAIVGYRAATLTSVMAGRLFSSPYNDDFKLIAFSDSVQDAAHRAGFLGANTWRTVLRQAMAKWLRAQPVGVSLREMADLLPQYWRDRIGSDARFAGLFIAPNMLWYQDYNYLIAHGRLPERNNLAEQVSRRLAWECLTEFGRRSRVGRSLERSDVATATFDERQLGADVRKIATQLREEIEFMRGIDDELFLTFVSRWLLHLRQVGAIYDPSLDLYLKERGRDYLLNRVHWMPNYYRAQRPPAAITLGYMSQNFEALVQSNKKTWSERWLAESLGQDAIMATAEARQLFRLLLDGLTRRKWLIERDAKGESVWLLNPELITIEAAPVTDQNRIYGVTEPHRLVPSEHTGLLSADVRAQIEASFIEGHEPWDVNLLSATPTLEMGIDIGDLSSVFLCSVPPAQANYLQRMGRAGRKDGNALTVTIANGENHDLYFYQNPLEMIAGEVQTPGVFLKAIAVLERQLIAYCFDRWAASGIDDSAIPGQMRKVLDAVEHQQTTNFPHNLLAFVDANAQILLRSFEGMFEEIEVEERDYLAGFIMSTGEGSISWKVLNRLSEKVEQRQSQLRRAQQLKREFDRLKKLPDDESTREEIQGVTHERSAVLSLLDAINNQPVLNFFTDEGLLPNYAFPEEGVTLSSVIIRRRQDKDREEGSPAYDKMAYTFQRPAQAALGELAPESRFYAVSHIMEIDQIDLQLSRVEMWRFCDRCQYSERVDIADPHSACPKCGSAQWADSGQRHEVLRLRQVFSTVDDRSGRIGDEAERREPAFYNRQMLVDIPPDGHRGGFRIKSDVLPFGFEFLSRVTLREINFGPAGDETHSFFVAGEDRPRKGFRICRECGTVQRPRPREAEQNHGFTCRLRRNPEQEQPEDYLESLYLYRELNSEAIRILLPLSEVAYSDEKLHSFIAAINLGLKLYFRGDVHHLEVTSMREPQREGSGERFYLIIYDRIPGGTGYLKELMRQPANLMLVLEHARNHLRTCTCVDEPLRDGCYRCILAYRNSRNMPTISRNEAESLLGAILALRESLEPVAALSEINTNSLVESKLEQRFIEALSALPGAARTPMQLRGKNAHLFTIPGDDGNAVAWHIEHQIRLGPEQGVALNTEVDVLLTPARTTDAGKLLPIAVYMDGLQYHHDIVADDVAKRLAIALSGRYHVWTLGWDDLPAPGSAPVPKVIDLMAEPGIDHAAMTEMWHKVTEAAGWITPAVHQRMNGYGSFEWLEKVLRAPTDARQLLAQRAVWRGFTALLPVGASDHRIRQKLAYELAENAPPIMMERFDIESDERVAGGFMDAFSNSPGRVELTASLPLAAIRSGNPASIRDSLLLHLCFDDRDRSFTESFKDGWRAFWHAFNQLQFLPGFTATTRRNAEDGTLDHTYRAVQSIIAASRDEAAEAAYTATDTKWQEAWELSLLTKDQLEALIALDLPAPQVGYDLTDKDGMVVVDGGIVELAWPEQHVAILAGAVSDAPDNWTVLVVTENLVDEIKQLKEKGIL